MQKKSIFTILGIMLAVVVASLSLVFAVGPRVGADSEVVLNQESHFKINDSHQLTGISDAGKSLINGKNFRVEIPSSVTSIGGSAFAYCSGLTSIEIPSSVTSIGGSAFAYCSGLTSIEIPSGVTSIGYNVFYGCSGLTSITIPSSVTSIGGWAFKGCSGLTSIEIPSSVTSIVNSAFSGCSGLTTITVDEANPNYYSNGDNCIVERSTNTLITGCQNTVIPSSVTSIGEWAFADCSGLTSIEIPSSVTSIGAYAFYECSGLTSIEIPSSVTSIGNYAFCRCSGLTSIEIPSRVTSIGEWAFADCSGLTSIEIPSSVTSIGWYAFYECSGLTSIEIPSSVTSIGISAFDGCSDLTTIDCTAFESKPDGWDDDWLGNCDPSIVQWYPLVLTLTNNDTEYAVTGYSGTPTEIIIPAEWNSKPVTSIGDDAFYECSGLTSITIPSSVTSIGKYAFDYCYGLTTVTFAENSQLTSIGEWAFEGCSSLTSIEIPSSVTSIGYEAFSRCSGLTSIEIPSSVTSIGYEAFSRCSGLTSIEIPSSVTSIDYSAFADCSGLTTITFAENSQLTSIGDGVFYYCSGLTSIEIPSSVTSIGGYAFAFCSGLTSIEIPFSVTSIGDNAFLECSGLTQIIVENPDLMLAPSLQQYQNILHCSVTCTVNFSVEGIVIDSQEIEYGKNIELPVVPIKKGYYIVGWYRDAGYNEAFDYNPITEDLTLYAMLEPISVTVVFNTVYGIIRTDYYTIGDTDLAYDVPELVGYEFCYWYRYDDFGYCHGDEWIFGHEPECLTPFDFHAGITSENVDWNYPYIYLLPKYEIKWVTVNFDSNGGSTVDSVTLQSGVTLSMSEQPTLEHYNFQYWYLSDENEPFVFEDNAITNDITLHAKWAVSSYSVIFNPRNGDEATVESVVYQGTVTQPADPSKSGHTFQGWYTDAECTQAYTFGDEVTGNITLYAKWKAEICTVTFSINGVESSQSVEYGQTVTMDIPTQDGYTFIGWYTQNNVLFSLDTPITSDINLHAVWGINYFIVTFMDDGSVINRQNVNVNSKVVKPTDPTQSGYVFDGWYTDESLENAYDFDSVVTNNFTLYAKWIEDVPVETEPESTGVDKHNNNVTIAAIAGGVGAGVVCVGGTILTIVLKKRRKL